MADMGRAQKSIILDLVNNIAQFNEIVREEIRSIERNADGLSSCWDDPQYRDFLNFTNDIAAQLKRDIEALETVERNLRIKADKF